MSSDLARAILKHYQSAVLARKAEEIIQLEVQKGCTRLIAPGPVELEPPYDAITLLPPQPRRLPSVPWVQAQPQDPGVWQREQVWMSTEQEGDWKTHSERFLKQLHPARHRVGVELVGNVDRVDQLLFFHQEDRARVHAAFLGEFKRCQLTAATWCPHAFRPGMTSTVLRLLDFYPLPPYTRLLTRFDELRESVYGTIISALATIPREAFGLFQAIFQPAQHDWHVNVQALVDLEHERKQMVTWQAAQMHAHSPPSWHTSHVADRIETKAHNDKPFFFTSLRLMIGGIEQDPDQHLDALSTFTGLVQHGGRPLEALSDVDYLQVIPQARLGEMVAAGEVWRPGFLLNSEELGTLAHFCPPKLSEFRPRPLVPLEKLSPSPDLATGVQIGICDYAGKKVPVCIPYGARCKHSHIIGRPGTGKSSLLENMILQEIALGHGVALIDPHGTLVERLLGLIPPNHIDRVVFIDPADPLHVPIWNPLHCGAKHGPERIADDLLDAFHAIVEGWGDRLAHLLRHALFALLHLPGVSLLDVNNLLCKGSEASNDLIQTILSGPVTNSVARKFWAEQFTHYGNDAIGPPLHKLSKLLVGGSMSLMLSQPESRIDFRRIMDEGKILLVDLHGLGGEARDTLGCFMLALLHLTAIGRLDSRGRSPNPFHIYCDEAHRFPTEAIDQIIAETRKYEVSLTLAHQFMSQFTSRKAGALSSVASTVIFGVDENDAEYLKKDLLGRVDVTDLIDQSVGCAIARIGTGKRTEVVRVHVLPRLENINDSQRELIIAQSHRLYYEPVKEVQRRLDQNTRPRPVQIQNTTSSPKEERGFEYDEL